MTHLIATFFYVGHLRPAPGTWGSLAALPVAWALFQLGGWPAVAVGAVVAFFAGWWATAVETRGMADHDPSEIVIDEVAGQWIALIPVMVGATHAGADVLALWPGWVVGFLAFRAFDILKPGPIGRADRRGDALGVMLDDIFAGIAAALTVGITGYLWHSLFL
ncbi:MAG: phosphatidylglycerophosphatase A [Rhodobacterales bacterium]|nr:MAG: phosphatidylglycerophosphatase A [Rhodobacterales bacterium]